MIIEYNLLKPLVKNNLEFNLPFLNRDYRKFKIHQHASFNIGRIEYKFESMLYLIQQPLIALLKKR